MGVNRVFVSQQTLDRWLSEERVEVDGEEMILWPEGQRFRLKTAVHFVEELEGEDQAGLLHKVKDLDELDAVGGEHFGESVVVGEEAYQVVEGFTGEPLVQTSREHEPADAPRGSDLGAAARAAAGDGPPSNDSEDVDMLARFFMNSSARRQP